MLRAKADSSLALGTGLVCSVVLTLHVWRSLVVGMDTALLWKTWAEGVGSLHRLWSHRLTGSTGPAFHRAPGMIHRSQPCPLTSVCLGQGTTYRKREYNMKTMRKTIIDCHTVAIVNRRKCIPKNSGQNAPISAVLRQRNAWISLLNAYFHQQYLLHVVEPCCCHIEMPSGIKA